MKIISFVTLATCIFSCTVFAQSSVSNQRLFDTTGFVPDHYPQRLARFEKEPMTQGAIIFLGNSITEMGDWKTLLSDSNVINRGISGDISYGVLKRLDEIIKRQPKKIFILIGINDIGKDIPDIVIADNIRKMILKLQAGSPNTRIYLQTILPVNPDVKNFPQHYDKQEHVLATNKLLEEVAHEAGVRFVDLHSLFLDQENKMDKKYTVDGLHINKSGYDLWIKFLRDSGCLK